MRLFEAEYSTLDNMKDVSHIKLSKKGLTDTTKTWELTGMLWSFLTGVVTIINAKLEIFTF